MTTTRRGFIASLAALALAPLAKLLPEKPVENGFIQREWATRAELLGRHGSADYDCRPQIVVLNKDWMCRYEVEKS